MWASLGIIILLECDIIKFVWWHGVIFIHDVDWCFSLSRQMLLLAERGNRTWSPLYIYW